jgi:hypothetical protein
MFQATGPPVDDVALKHDDFNLPCLPWEIVIRTVPSKFCTRLDIQNVPHFLKDLRPEEIDDNSKCLWTSLREAFVHAGVVALSTSEDDVRKETLTVEHTHCTLHKSEGGIFWDENKSKNYLQVRQRVNTFLIDTMCFKRLDIFNLNLTPRHGAVYEQTSNAGNSF